ncbi:hypothetical protein [Hymenobacter crusticola]|uniref:Uncharacterized protein n=1 Tax=Hymenobacter crusticola TaxID=1770526 RepID=A0A243W6W6_9BACT|nr:hypothetical protein [Hymenobacter crusticola]OUJ69937.1 hypothetical protein BXP70_25690 [Hymenobacter crusticola]
MPGSTIYHLEQFGHYENGLRLYTLRKEDAELSEAADFFERMEARAATDEVVAGQLDRFLAALEQIDERGYSLFKTDLLRQEARAQALPPTSRYMREIGVDQTSLRLYCYAAGNRTLVLFNGDVKTTDQAQNCPNVARHFQFAQQAALALDQCRRDWEVASDDGELLLDPPELFIR